MSLHNVIDKKISEALKEKNALALEVFRAIKNEFLLFQTNGSHKELTDEVENKILSKMVSRASESIRQFKEANRDDLVEKETEQMNFISQFLPKIANEEETQKAV